MRNRMVEIHGLMGAIGEQVGLCWTAEQDAQRVERTASTREVDHQRLIHRATVESAALFLLGAGHALGNLALRVALLNDDAARVITRRHPRAKGFPPGDDERDSWLTLHKAQETLRVAADGCHNRHLVRISNAIRDLHKSPAFRELDDRRGLDYHRRRPQSVRHASPRRGTVVSQPDGTVRISMVGASLEPEANASVVHSQLVRAMQALLSQMRVLRTEIPKAIRAEQISYR